MERCGEKISDKGRKNQKLRTICEICKKPFFNIAQQIAREWNEHQKNLDQYNGPSNLEMHQIKQFASHTESHAFHLPQTILDFGFCNPIIIRSKAKHRRHRQYTSIWLPTNKTICHTISLLLPDLSKNKTRAFNVSDVFL